MLREFLGQSTTTSSSGVHGVVDGNLAVLMVQPGVNIFATLLEDLLSENNRLRRCVREEVVLGDNTTLADGGAAIITQMEDARLYAQPTGSFSKKYERTHQSKLTSQGNAP